MKKQSVNGKSFDEIFAQRGNRVEVDEMEQGMFYINDETLIGWSCIFKLYKKEFGFAEKLFRAYYAVNRNGYYGTDRLIRGESFYEATPDQIALLNAYKNA
jgi:hypothetical protein